MKSQFVYLKYLKPEVDGKIRLIMLISEFRTLSFLLSILCMLVASLKNKVHSVNTRTGWLSYAKKFKYFATHHLRFTFSVLIIPRHINYICINQSCLLDMKNLLRRGSGDIRYNASIKLSRFPRYRSF